MPCFLCSIDKTGQYGAHLMMGTVVLDCAASVESPLIDVVMADETR